MPSNNIEIEQAVLGSLLLNVNAYPEVDAKLTAEDFVSEVHSDIYKCIKHLAESGKGTDYISVSRELDRNNLLERIGGVDYLKELQDTPVTARNAESYAESVKSQSLDRKFKIVLQELLKISENPEGKSSNEILEEAETKIFDLAQNRINNETMRPIDELVGVSMDKIEDLMSKDGDLVGHSYGYKDIDALTLGLKEEELIIIAGRPSMGKTSLGMNIAEHVAMNEEGYVLVFSLEMSAESLTARMLGSRAGVSMKNVYSGTISDQQLEKLTRMGDELSKSNLLIDDAGNITPPEIRAKCRKVARAAREKGGIKLVLIDYIQLMQMPGRNDNRVNELSDISRSLKHLAKELKCPVIVLSQLNRNVDARENKRPRMSDLRDSGAIEQDADLIYMLYRQWVYQKEEEYKNVAEINLVKHRNGPIENVLLSFEESNTRFAELHPSAKKDYRDWLKAESD